MQSKSCRSAMNVDPALIMDLSLDFPGISMNFLRVFLDFTGITCLARDPFDGAKLDDQQVGQELLVPFTAELTHPREATACIGNIGLAGE